MEVKWKTGEPPVDEKTGMSKQLVVKTNHDYYNCGYWSTRNQCWYLDGLVANRETVVEWLDGLE